MQNNTLNKNAESSPKSENVSKFLSNLLYIILSSQKEPQSLVNTRSRRVIKKVKEDESFISDINEIFSSQDKKSHTKNSKKKEATSQNNKSSSNLNKDFLDEDEMNQMMPNDNNDIVMEGNLFYRYGMDQIELDGQWSLSSETTECRFSCILSSKRKVMPVRVGPKDFGVKDFGGYGRNINDANSQEKNENNNINKTMINNYDIMMKCNQYFDQTYKKYVLNLCSANIFEALLIPDYELFKYILSFLSGEYHGFFVYFGKTIEDYFNLNFNYEDNQVRVSGSGKNNLGDFNIIGYVNFFTMKEQLLNNNSLDSEVIKFGIIKLTRIYSDFNSNENNRVIKSFQHSRKKYDEFGD